MLHRYLNLRITILHFRLFLIFHQYILIVMYFTQSKNQILDVKMLKFSGIHSKHKKNWEIIFQIKSNLFGLNSLSLTNSVVWITQSLLYLNCNLRFNAASSSKFKPFILKFIFLQFSQIYLFAFHYFYFHNIFLSVIEENQSLKIWWSLTF